MLLISIIRGVFVDGAQCLRNGILPFGILTSSLATHADPQSGVWYPVVWLMSLFVWSIYTFTVCNWDFAACYRWWCGDVVLLQRFHVNPFIALINTITYMFCGLFVGNAQHLTFCHCCLLAAFCYFAFKNMAEHNHWRFALHFALFVTCWCRGGYPAFAIILFLYSAYCNGISFYPQPSE